MSCHASTRSSPGADCIDLQLHSLTMSYGIHIVSILLLLVYVYVLHMPVETLIDRARQGALFVRQGLYKGAVFKPHPQH